MAEANPDPKSLDRDNDADVSGKDDDDRGSVSSDSGSISFVITDDLDKEMMSYMTQSQYSQVTCYFVTVCCSACSSACIGPIGLT